MAKYQRAVCGAGPACSGALETCCSTTLLLLFTQLEKVPSGSRWALTMAGLRYLDGCICHGKTGWQAAGIPGACAPCRLRSQQPWALAPQLQICRNDSPDHQSAQVCTHPTVGAGTKPQCSGRHTACAADRFLQLHAAPAMSISSATQWLPQHQSLVEHELIACRAA